MSVRNSEQILGPGTCLVLRRTGAFSLRCIDEGYTGICVNSFHPQDMDRVGDPLIRPLDGFLLQLLTIVDRELTEGGGPTLGALGLALLEASWRHVTSQDTPTQADPKYWAQRVQSRLDANLGSGNDIAQILDGLGLSYRQLARHFEAQMAMTPKEYVQGKRIAEAKHLLGSTELSMLSIAMELGFPSSQHFATSFRQSTGLTPSQWRQKRGQM